MLNLQPKKVKEKTKKTAFSLLELSVVILIIGILITGVMKGGSLVSASRLNSARSLTARSSVGEINGLTAWYETTSLQSFGKRVPGGSGAPPTPEARISVVQLTDSRRDQDRIEIWRDVSPKCINNYSIVNTSTVVSAVTQTADYINTCNALSQATIANRPYYSLSGINSLPSVSFENGNNLLLDASFKDGNISVATKFVVFSIDVKPPSANTATILNNNPELNEQRIFIDPTNIAVSNGGIGGNANIQTSYTIKNTYILGVIFAGANSYYKINNGTLTTLNLGANTTSALIVGGINFIGKISEIIVFNRMLKESEMIEIFNYLGKKYKVQVL